MNTQRRRRRRTAWRRVGQATHIAPSYHHMTARACVCPRKTDAPRSLSRARAKLTLMTKTVSVRHVLINEVSRCAAAPRCAARTDERTARAPNCTPHTVSYACAVSHIYVSSMRVYTGGGLPFFPPPPSSASLWAGSHCVPIVSATCGRRLHVWHVGGDI